MRVLTYYSFLSIVLSSKMSSSSELKTEDYIQLISEIYDIYRPSSVLLVHFKDIHSPSGMSIVFEMILMLSRRRILTKIIQFEEAHPSENYSNPSSDKGQGTRIDSRSMSVFLFTSQEDIDQFENSPQHINIHVSINLLLLMTTERFLIESSLNESLFRFDATILIKFYGNPAIKQWYPLNSDKTKFISWGHWEPNTKLILKKNDLNHSKSMGLGGKILRIATVKGEDRKLIGYLKEVLSILEELMNFEAKHVNVVNEFGIWNGSTRTWSGAMGLTTRGDIDFVLSCMILTQERLLSVDFSIPIIQTQKTLFVKEPGDKTGYWTGYFQPFDHRIWIAIALLILTAPLVLTLMKIMLKNSYSISNLIPECYLNVWSIYCQQGLKEFPTKSSLRLAYSSIFVCSFIMMALYSASLISYLTVPTSSLPFSTLEGFVEDGSYKLIVLKDGSEFDMFSITNDSVFSQMNKLMLPRDELPPTKKDGYNRVCNDRVAFHDMEIVGVADYISFPCQVVKLHSGQFNSAGMILTKGSPYTKMINYYLNKFRNTGLLSRLKSKYYKRVVHVNTVDFISVGISGIVGLLVLLAGGISLAIIVLIIERIHFNHRLENLQKPIGPFFEMESGILYNLSGSSTN